MGGIAASGVGFGKHSRASCGLGELGDIGEAMWTGNTEDFCEEEAKEGEEGPKIAFNSAFVSLLVDSG